MNIRPHDVVLALRLATRPGEQEPQRAVAAALGISASEVNHGFARLERSGLYNRAEHRVVKAALREFLLFGLKYVFPAEVGAVARGVPTAHSAAPLASRLLADPDASVVWPAAGLVGLIGLVDLVRGRQVEPLYPGAPQAAARDPKLHEYLALVDAIRVGRARERKMAADELTARLS